ncbi:MAG: ABC transporter permease [Acidobacteria bacterium]|nr:ABC transporter permease [Acidobacteriota bacterium]
MLQLELVRFVISALRGQRLRSFLSGLGVAIGVAAVVILTSLGEGARQYVMSQFTQFGTNLMAVNPGRVKTMGMPGVLGGTTHKLSIDDAIAIGRLTDVERVVPVVTGQGRVEGNGRGRSVFIYGVTHDATAAWKFSVSQGRFLPPMDPHRRASFIVLGPKLAHELFPESSPLGRRVRVAGWSFRVIGVMTPKGHFLGFDLDDAAYIPVATAMALFNVDELNEVDVLAASSEAIVPVKEALIRMLTARHRGNYDFTVTTQDEMLATFGRVIGVITVAVSGIGAISLFVGAMGILTIMWISVNDRTAEIGLLRALGVRRGTVERLFLLESVVLAAAGGIGGVAVGLGLGAALRFAVPGFPFETPAGAIAAAIAMSVVVGIASGVVPARRAASLDPIEALREE